MKMIHTLVIIFVLISCLTACNTITGAPRVMKAAGVERITSPDVPRNDLKAVADGNNAFAFDLYQAINDGDDNLIFSPYSISLALAMVYAGAKGDTAQQMAETLHWTLPQERLHPAFNALDLALADRGGEEEGDFQLHIANAVWGQKGLAYLPEYLGVLALNYGAGLQIVDFERNPAGATQAINTWVSEQTEERIPEIVSKLDPLTRLVLANAIYFNAAWEFPFDEAKTRDKTFYLLDGREIKAPMMHQTNHFAYNEGDGYQAIRLPYPGNIAMVILLPREGRFQEIEMQLTDAWIQDIIFWGPEVILTMPKFRFGTPVLNLKETLSGMGMPKAFSEQDADFSGIISAEPGHRFCIGEVLHKAFIDVNEKKTEAAAVTVVKTVEVGDAEKPQLIEMSIDRPFIFFIRDLKTGAILFAGRVMNPAVNQ